MSESIQGACLCGETKISIKIPPGGNTQGLCHCADCKHTSGSAFSTNILVPTPDIRITGAHAKEYASVAPTGATVTRVFCSNCGSPLAHRSTLLERVQPVQVGSFGARLEGAPVVVEFFTKDRWGWVRAVEGAKQELAMAHPPAAGY